MEAEKEVEPIRCLQCCEARQAVRAQGLHCALMSGGEQPEVGDEWERHRWRSWTDAEMESLGIHPDLFETNRRTQVHELVWAVVESQCLREGHEMPTPEETAGPDAVSLPGRCTRCHAPLEEDPTEAVVAALCGDQPGLDRQMLTTYPQIAPRLVQLIRSQPEILAKPMGRTGPWDSIFDVDPVLHREVLDVQDRKWVYNGRTWLSLLGNGALCVHPGSHHDGRINAWSLGSIFGPYAASESTPTTRTDTAASISPSRRSTS